MIVPENERNLPPDSQGELEVLRRVGEEIFNAGALTAYGATQAITSTLSSAMKAADATLDRLGLKQFKLNFEEEKASDNGKTGRDAKIAGREDIEKLVSQLGDNSFDRRESASQKLKELGAYAFPHLNDALKNPDLEIRHRSERLLKDAIMELTPRESIAGWHERWKDQIAKGLPVPMPPLPDEKLPAESRQENAKALAVLAKLSNLRDIVPEPQVKEIAQLAQEERNPEEALKRLRDVTHLDLFGDKITDADLRRLKDVTPNLEYLILKNTTAVTGKGIEELKGFSKLEILSLESDRAAGGRPSVTDETLAHLKGLKSLKILDINSNGVTDKGLEKLSGAGLQSITGINVNSDNVTPYGQQRLQKQLPEVEINLWGKGGEGWF